MQLHWKHNVALIIYTQNDQLCGMLISKQKAVGPVKRLVYSNCKNKQIKYVVDVLTITILHC
jgi:hypothetical protein